MREKLDQLIEKITQAKFADEILEARKEYQKLAGEIYEDDKFYEGRMGMFLEWYMFDRAGSENQLTPLETLINNNAESAEELKTINGFAKNIHGLFIIKKIRYKEVVALNLFDDKKYTVREPEGQILFQKNELIEGRIVSNNDEYYFTGNFCFHPKEAYKFIKGEAKKIAVLREGYLKDLKIIDARLKGLNHKLDKNGGEIEKFNAKIKENRSEEKFRIWNDQLDTLKKQRADLMQQVSVAEAEKSDLETGKLKNEINRFSNDLIQKLNYMNLKWERSRQIDLQDIYRF